MLNSFTGILIIILGFGFLIFVHELGHFLVAKWVKIRATQFAIGFGQSMVSWRKGIGFKVGSTEPEYFKRAEQHLVAKGMAPTHADAEETPEGDDEAADAEHSSKYDDAQLFAAADELGLGETEYRLNWLPLGGYVKMLGQEDMDPGAQSGDPRAYNRKPVWARMCVISAGVIMNLIFGLLFFMAAFMMGVDFPAAEVGSVRAASPAATTYAEGHDGDPSFLGLKPGDELVEIDGKRTQDFQDVMLSTALGDRDTAVAYGIRRYGHDDLLTYRLTPQRDRDQKLLSIGITPPQTTIVGFIDDGDPEGERLYKAGVRPDMAITHVDGTVVESYSHLNYLVENSGGKSLELTFGWGKPDGEVTASVLPSPTLVERPEVAGNLLGLLPTVMVTTVQENSPAEAAGIQAKDIIARVGQAAWPASPEEVIAAVHAADGDEIPLEVWRDGKIVELGAVEPTRKNIIGIGIVPHFDAPIVGRVAEGSAMAGALTDPLPPGSQLVQINGADIADWRDIQRAFAGVGQAGDVELTFQLALAESPSETVTASLTDEQIAEVAGASWRLNLTGVGFAPRQATVKAEGPIDAAGIGLVKTKQFIVQTYLTLGRLIQGNIKIYHLRGPVGIVHEGSRVARAGWPYILFFMGLISVNLAVINFLPIPVVDGGHMVFLIAEKIRGKPVPASVQIGALYAGLALIAFVFLATLFYDVERLLPF